METTNVKNTSKSSKVLTIIGIILCVILIPILIVNVTLIIKSVTNKDEVPSMFGVAPMIVLTNSMYPEIESGDLIICNCAEAKDVKEKDVICFFDPDSNGQSVVTHRVVAVLKDGDGNIQFQTKGDANKVVDPSYVPANNLVGIYNFKIKGAGNVALFMQTTWGLVICVVLPLALLILYDTIRRRMYEKNNAQKTSEMREELERLRQEKEEQSKENSVEE